jgi:hypothetical protein
MQPPLYVRDRSRGLPSLGYQLRQLEKRVRRLETALLAITTDRRVDAEYPTKETKSEQFPDR